MSRLKGSTSGRRYSGKALVGSWSRLRVVLLRGNGFLGMTKVWLDRASEVGNRLLWSLCLSALRKIWIRFQVAAEKTEAEGSIWCVLHQV